MEEMPDQKPWSCSSCRVSTTDSQAAHLSPTFLYFGWNSQRKPIMLFPELQKGIKSVAESKVSSNRPRRPAFQAPALFRRRSAPREPLIPTEPQSVLLSRLGGQPRRKWYSVYVRMYMPLPYHLESCMPVPFLIWLDGTLILGYYNG
jgi:hypothetical protein